MLSHQLQKDRIDGEKSIIQNPNEQQRYVFEQFLDLLSFRLSFKSQRAVDDTAKGGLTQFWELFTVIPCAPKDFKR